MATKQKIKKILGRVAKQVEQFAKSKVKSKRVFKKAPRRATYVVPSNPDYQRSSFFNQQYEREKNIVSWR